MMKKLASGLVRDSDLLGAAVREETALILRCLAHPGDIYHSALMHYTCPKYSIINRQG